MITAVISDSYASATWTAEWSLQ